MLLPYVQDVYQPPVHARSDESVMCNFERVAYHCATGFVLDMYTATTVLKQFGVTPRKRLKPLAPISVTPPNASPVPAPVTSPRPTPAPAKVSATDNEKCADRPLKRKRQLVSSRI